MKLSYIAWIQSWLLTYYETLNKLLNLSIFYFLINKIVIVCYLFNQSHKVIVIRIK